MHSCESRSRRISTSTTRLLLPNTIVHHPWITRIPFFAAVAFDILSAILPQSLPYRRDETKQPFDRKIFHNSPFPSARRASQYGSRVSSRVSFGATPTFAHLPRSVPLLSSSSPGFSPYLWPAVGFSPGMVTVLRTRRSLGVEILAIDSRYVQFALLLDLLLSPGPPRSVIVNINALSQVLLIVPCLLCLFCLLWGHFCYGSMLWKMR